VGPYRDGAHACIFLSSYVDKTCGTSVGFVWATDRGLYPLRAPQRDGQGLGEVLVFQWTALPPPPPKPRPLTRWEKVKAGIRWMLEQEGKAQIAEAQARRSLTLSATSSPSIRTTGWAWRSTSSA
jgi:hypothetical protein